jgi:predicted permease
MDSELASHLEFLTQDLVQSGFSTVEATRRARVALGPALKHKEEMRASIGLRWFDELWADLCYGARILRKSPGFTAIAVLSLALAIGANTTIFSVAKQVLYERLAVAQPQSLRVLEWTGMDGHVAVHSVHGDWNVLPGGQVISSVFPYPAFQQLRAQNRVLNDLIAFSDSGMNATIRGEAQRAQVEIVSGNYYAVLGVRAELGRVLLPADDSAPGQGAVAVISDGLWGREFARSAAVLGQTIKLNDVVLTIVGVAPRGFTGGKDALHSPDVFVPLSMEPMLLPATDGTSWLANPAPWWVHILGRTKPGVKDPEARAALNVQLAAFVRQTAKMRPDEGLPQIELRDGSRGLFAQEKKFARPMAVLLTLVGFVLLLACANIANLMLARGSQRLREMSIRMALGAGRARVVRQMLVESLLLATFGGGTGLLAGYLGSQAIPRMLENAWERTDFHIQFDWRIFAFTAGITVMTGILFGLAPAVDAAHADVSRGLKDASLAATRRRKGTNGKALVGFQIALSTLLVIGAGLFIRTFAGLKTVNLGFRTDHLLLAAINPPQTRYAAGKDIALHQRLEQAFANVPGVDSVAASSVAYINDDSDSTDFLPQGESYDRTKHQSEYYTIVGNRFFETLGIPIVEGRSFGEQDTQSSQKVAIINQSLARKRFPGQNPIGKLFKPSLDAEAPAGTTAVDWIKIVGVCGDTRYWNLRNEPPPQFFVPYVQLRRVDGMVYQFHTRMNPETIVPSLRSVLRQADPDLALLNVRTQDQQVQSAMQEERLFVTLTAGFGLLALALACVGIYGIMAYSVANRRNEIGIRLALGAQPGQVRSMILCESTQLAVVGIVAGMAAALGLTRLVATMLYGIQPYDPVTLAAGASILLVVALAAGWIPARRAAAVQPMEALRHE